MRELSILIPARNEEFLAKTIENILENIEADTEIIAVMDGQWNDPPVPQHEKVKIIKTGKVVGQRAATNLACKISTAKYVMKVDAHCAFDKGFDRKLIADMQDDWTVVPTMRNLWAFDWKCMKCGKRVYQDKSNVCPVCNVEMKKKMVWQGKESPQSNSYTFDTEPHFQYFRDYNKRPEGKGDLTESMSLQGSFFMCTRDKYWELNLCDEKLGSWGSQGIEVAVKTWLSGGKVMVNQKTWYAHMFRTKPQNGFGFPYEQKGSEVAKTKQNVKDLFWENKWDKQVKPLSWLVERFWPIPNWTEEDLNKLKIYGVQISTNK